MSNEETKQCSGTVEECASGKCSDCQCEKEAKPKTNTMPSGEKVVSFDKEPSIADVAKMLLNDEGFVKATKGAQIVATRVLKHPNGQDAVLQIFFHKNVADKIIVTNEMPKEK